LSKILLKRRGGEMLFLVFLPHMRLKTTDGARRIRTGKRPALLQKTDLLRCFEDDRILPLFFDAAEQEEENHRCSRILTSSRPAALVMTTKTTTDEERINENVIKMKPET
jgi:hypothetical protein